MSETKKIYYVHTETAGREVIDDFWTTRKHAVQEVERIKSESGRSAWIVVHEVPA